MPPRRFGPSPRLRTSRWRPASASRPPSTASAICPVAPPKAWSDRPAPSRRWAIRSRSSSSSTRSLSLSVRVWPRMWWKLWPPRRRSSGCAGRPWKRPCAGPWPKTVSSNCSTLPMPPECSLRKISPRPASGPRGPHRFAARTGRRVPGSPPARSRAIPPFPPSTCPRPRASTALPSPRRFSPPTASSASSVPTSKSLGSGEGKTEKIKMPPAAGGNHSSRTP